MDRLVSQTYLKSAKTNILFFKSWHEIVNLRSISNIIAHISVLNCRKRIAADVKLDRGD
jgi:hypothetical protein